MKDFLQDFDPFKGKVKVGKTLTPKVSIMFNSDAVSNTISNTSSNIVFRTTDHTIWTSPHIPNSIAYTFKPEKHEEQYETQRMPKGNWTKIVCIIDKSGSMDGLQNETIKNFNRFLKEQKELGDNAQITTILFDTEVRTLYSNKNIKNVPKLTSEEYRPDGYTALLDAVGIGINDAMAQLESMKEEFLPSKIIFVIITDGEENSSDKYTKPYIKDLITHNRKFHKWMFFFLGANIDAFAEAGGIGISQHFTSPYTYSTDGVTSAYSAVSNTICNLRQNKDIDDNWKKDIK